MGVFDDLVLEYYIYCTTAKIGAAENPSTEPYCKGYRMNKGLTWEGQRRA